MNVLIVGSGGREHALAWKCLQSPRLTQLYLAPGNAGTDQLRVGTSTIAQNVPIAVEDNAALVAFAREHQIDLVIVGPEVPLANGLADDLRAAGVKTFGPSRAAAEIESSKVFAKEFMRRHNIPTAGYAVFTDLFKAIGHTMFAEYPLVVKASGLAAGKGVVVATCAHDAEVAVQQMIGEHVFGAAGETVVIEDYLTGPEVSLLAFTDGVTIKVMPPAQDHKRLLDGDEGPNTGGMGAFAPTPACPPELVAELTRTFLQPVVDGLRTEGRTFSGVLYAGLMLTPNGPRALEFNCRFGDPETQVLMPLLDSDLLDITEACADGRLAETDVRWKDRAAVCVVLASEGYPGKYPSGRVISGLDALPAETVAFHAGTKRNGDAVVSAGGRVVDVTAWSDDAAMASALSKAYAAVSQIHFDGMQYRTDIGAQAIGQQRITNG